MKCIEKDKIDVGAGPRACPDFTKDNHRGLPLQKELPEGWMWKTMGEIADIIRGVSYNKSDATEIKQDAALPILRATNIQDNGLVLDCDMVYVPQKYVSEEQMLKVGDIVIATSSGSKHLVGKTAQIKTEWIGSFGVFCVAVRPTSEIEPRYLGYFLNSPAYKSYIAAKAMGVNINNLRRGDIEEISVPLAPIDQQKLIVSEIEKQFSRLDEAVAALKRVRASLKRYKASVLKSAVEGKLTEEWRKQNPNVEPADKLLKRILAERKKKWEESNPKKKYKEPVAPDTSNLPELPKGWMWVNFMHLASPDKNSIKRGPFGSAIKKAFFVRKGYKVYEQQNAIYNNPKLGNYYIGEEKYNELIGFTVISGDFIISCSGTIGKIAQIPEGAEKGIINQALLKISIDSKLVSSKYFLYLFKSEDFQKSFLKDTRGTAMKNIASVEDLKLIPVALPPLHEQIAIVEEIESRLSVVEEIEEVIDINLKRAEHLRQAILKKAFSGRLV